MRSPGSNPKNVSRRPWVLALTVGLTAVVLGVVQAKPPSGEAPVTEAPKHSETSTFMRAKLASSQLVLEGLVTEDFELVIKGASQMSKMSEAAEWPRSPDKVYDHYSEEFRRLASKLSGMAKRKNLEGSSFTYMHMTALCIDCHEYVRGSLRVARDPAGAPGGVRLIPSEWPE